ncbi:hypothetical protein STEG23_037160 [Scotinomys teguina]
MHSSKPSQCLCSHGSTFSGSTAEIHSDEDSEVFGQRKQDPLRSWQARTSSAILNKYGESGQPCVVPDFSGIALRFSPFNLMLAVGLLQIAFIMFSTWYLFRKLSISLRFSNFVEYRFLKYDLMILWISALSVVVSPLSFLIFVDLDALSLSFG